MIDIHSHILHGVDDGAKTLEDSIAMGRQEFEGGTTVVFATPHIYSSTDLAKAPEFVERMCQLQEDLDREGVGIKIAQGAEVFPMMEILDALKQKTPITLAG